MSTFIFYFLKKKKKKKTRSAAISFYSRESVGSKNLEVFLTSYFTTKKLTIDQMLDDTILSNKLSLQSVKHRDETSRGSKWFRAETSEKFSANRCTELIDWFTDF